MFKRVCAAVLAVFMLVALTACGGEKHVGQMLANGWVVRGDADGIGENEKWYKGFTEENDEVSEIKWYANKFSASLAKGDRVILSASDLGKDTTLWLNGKSIDSREDAAGTFYLDVTDAIKRNGNNVLVLKTNGYAHVDSIGLSVRPKMTVAEVTAAVTGDDVAVTALMDNSGGKADVNFMVEVTALDSGKVMSRTVELITVQEGLSKQAFTLSIPDHIHWNTDMSYLYQVTVKAQTESSADVAGTTIGFAELTKDEAGYFLLNGTPIFLRAVDLPERVLKDDVAMRRFVDYARTVEFNAVCPLTTPTKALLDYCDQTGMMVLSDTAVSGAESHVSLMTVSASDMTVMGEGLSFATDKPIETLEQFYKEMGLNRIYGGAVDLYKAMGDVYVERLSAAIREARKNGATAIRMAAGIDGYPESMIVPLADGIEELRYILKVDPVIYKGGSVSVSLDLVDYDVLWDGAKLEAYIKITNDTGIVWESTVPFTTADSALGHSTAFIPLLKESVAIAEAGVYTVAVELKDLAHPVCGETQFCVVDRPNLSGATVVKDVLTDDAIAKAQAGGKVILLNASAQSNLPFAAEFVEGITGAVVDNRVNAGFAAKAIADLDGVAFDRAIKAEGGTSFLTGFGIQSDNVLKYGSVIATYPVGSGSITVVTADVDVTNPAVAAILAAAIG